MRAERARRERDRVQRDADNIRARCQTLGGFIREAWHVLEPKAKYQHNWHIDIICAHLEAVTRGEITRLLINVWPGSMKSLIVSVLWPAWEWGPKGMRSLRYVSTSFNDKPVTRDTRKTRDLIASEWYQMLWPEVELIRSGETSFANSDTGTREGIPFGSLTSQRGDRLTIDDPHSTETAESETDRNNTTRKFREGAVNRLNDQEKSAIIVIMQRLHQDDLSGVIKQYGLEYVHVMLPMEFEPARRCETPWGRDPRSYEGELADPNRFPPATIADLKKSGEYFWSGQYQQRPAPREGGLFKVEMMELVDAAPIGGTIVSAWDLAGSTKKTSPYTARVRMKRVRGVLYIEDVRRERKSPNEVEEMILEAAEDDGPSIMQALPQDPGQAGKAQKMRFAELLAGFIFRCSPERGSKEDRARPFAAQIEAGNVRMVRAPWNSAYKEELRNFPSGSFKDQVDASSRAFLEILAMDRDSDDDIAAPLILEPDDFSVVA